MKSPMDFVEESYLSATGWGSHASYADIIQTSRNILDFDVTSGAYLRVTNQSSPLMVNSQCLTHVGSVGGSMAYMYTSIPVALPRSASSPLEKLVQRYRHPLYNALATLSGRPESSIPRQVARNRNTLLFGQLFFPSRSLEAMALAQLSSDGSHLALRWICDSRNSQPVVLTATYRALKSKWSREFIYSTHENLVGFRALGTIADWDDGPARTQLAVGCEIFYAASRKSPGASVGARVVTSSKHTLTPLTVTLVANPLMGSVGIAYALKPTPYVALATRFDFNFYSYISDLSVGCELWRTEPVSAQAVRDTMSKAEQRQITAPGAPPDKPMSVFKASTALATQSARLMWETTYRGLMVSLGTVIHYGNPNIPVLWGVDLNYAFSDVNDLYGETNLSCGETKSVVFERTESNQTGQDAENLPVRMLENRAPTRPIPSTTTVTKSTPTESIIIAAASPTDIVTAEPMNILTDKPVSVDTSSDGLSFEPAPSNQDS